MTHPTPAPPRGAALLAAAGAWWHRLSPVVGLALFAIAVMVLSGELKKMPPRELAATMRSVPPAALALAGVLTFLNYLILTGYDQLAFVYIRRPIARWQIAMASFVGYAIANNVGFALLSGTSARYRFYSRWGLSGEDISRVVLFYSSTYWLGLNVVGGWALAGGEIQGIDAYVPAALARLTGWLFIASACAYPLFVLLRRTPVCVGGVRIELPSMGLVGSQFLLSLLDWVLASAVLYVLVPSPRPDFLYFLGAFLAAQLVALISHVPGGLGVFESLMILLLQMPAAHVLPALALFRVIYYLVPLGGALLVLIVDEISQRRHQVVQWGNAFGTLTASVAPKLLAIFAMLAGGVLLASGSTPADSRRLQWLAGVLPLPAIEVAHVAASLAGVLLLVAAWGLARRLADAYRLAAAALGAGIVLSLLKGLDYETAAVLAALLGALAVSREEFGRRGALLDVPFSPSWVVSTLAIAGAAAGLGLFTYRHLDYSPALWWWVDLYGDMSRFLRASAAVLLALAGLTLARLLRRPRPAMVRPSADERDEAAALARNASTPGGPLVRLGDAALLWSPSRDACLMYGVHGHTWVALGEPIGASTGAESLVAQFLERCDDYSGLPVAYQAPKDWLHVYTDYGLTYVTLGEDARVFLPHFAIEGSGHRALRTTSAQLERQGIAMRVETPPLAAPLLATLAEVSDAWLNERGGEEQGFAASRFDPRYVASLMAVVAGRGTAIDAFATLWSLPGRHTLAVDLVRHRPGAPRGIVEGMITWLVLWARQHGYRWCDLGMAPPARGERPELMPFWRGLLKTAPGFGEGRPTMRTLREDRQRFDPVWEPRYLVYPGGTPLGGVLADVAALIAESGRR
jgi:phosphatidylglycerol lysyltransferase